MIEFDTLFKKCLDLAVKGKLVHQDPNDEPASELLKKIKAEKEQLIKDKKIKKDKNESTIFRGKDGLFYETIGEETKCIQEEIPFDIPVSWEWCRLCDIAFTMTGTTPPTSNQEYFGNFYHFIKPADIYNNTITFRDDGLSEIGATYSRIAPKDSILMVCIGGSIGKSAITSVDVCFNQQINSATMIGNICNYKFINHIFNSIFFQRNVITNASGTATPIIKKSAWELLLLPIPPLSEQKRIVEKLDEIKSNVELGKNAYTEITKEITPRLKKKVLDMAIKGKLVPQDPNDEPASELLKKIKAEKEQLIKDKKIKKDKNESTIFRGKDGLFYETIGEETKCIQDEIPFDIPDSWEWCRISKISRLVTKGTTPRGGNVSYSEQGVGFLRAENISEGIINKSNLKYIDELTHCNFLKRSILEEDDLLITIAGSLGRTAIVQKSDLPLNTNQAISIVRLVNTKMISLNYLSSCISSPIIGDNLIKQTKVTAIPNLTLEIISNCLFPLPPLSEQKRIVEEIEKIYSKIDLFDM